jgi:hypothetical protein
MAQVGTMVKRQPAGRGLLSFGDFRVLPGILTISSYVNAGGEAFDITTVFPNLAPRTQSIILFQQTSGRQFYYDPATKKVSAFTAAGVEVANATNIGAVPFLAIIPS